MNTTVSMSAPADEERGVRGVVVAQRVPLAKLPTVHAEAATGWLRDKVIAIPPGA